MIRKEHYRGLYRGFVISIEPDPSPTNPRIEQECVSKMICFHRRYNIGDRHEFKTPIEFRAFARSLKNAAIMPVFLYDHSGLAISVGSPSPYWHHAKWDSMMIGWVYIDLDNHDLIPDLDAAKTIIEGEVQEYNEYLSGDVWGYTVKPTERNKIDYEDNCWGFFGESGIEQAIEYAKEAIGMAIEDYKTKAVAAYYERRNKKDSAEDTKTQSITVPLRRITTPDEDEKLDKTLQGMTGYQVFDLLAIEYGYDRLLQELAHQLKLWGAK